MVGGAAVWWPHRAGMDSREPFLLTSSCLQTSLCPLELVQRVREELLKQRKEEQTRAPLL